MLNKKFAMLLFATASAAVPALANDSTAELSTGGLILVRNDNIEMRSEDLLISTREIAVRYRFYNTSNKPVRILVAFPMPEIKVDGPDDMIAVPTQDPVNLLAFTTSVNGKPIETMVEQRVTALGLDRTQLLRDLDIPLAPHLPSTGEALDRLPRDKWDELIRVGLAEIESYDAGKGQEEHLGARWALRTTFYWEQTFPAMAETAIEHHYQPSVGGSVQTILGDPAMANEASYQEQVRKFCVDNNLMAALTRARREARSQFGSPFSEERISYILHTGANWSGPIQHFRLVVDKGDADSLVSFCGEGVKKLGATQFEVTKTDFTPEEDLAVLILKRLPRQ
jgi:hypothetical protein